MNHIKISRVTLTLQLPLILSAVHVWQSSDTVSLEDRGPPATVTELGKEKEERERRGHCWWIRIVPVTGSA
jgi:hypothetical protein